MKPTIGRIVHYIAHETNDRTHRPRVYAAIISEVFEDETVSLHVFVPQSDIPIICFHPIVAKVKADPSSVEARGCWNWPPIDP